MIQDFKNILIVAATPFEIAPLRSFLDAKGINITANTFKINKKCIEILITGVGISKTSFRLGQRLAAKQLPDFAINVGIAGAFTHSLLPLGTVVEVVQECFADLGAEYRDGSFVHAFDMRLVPTKFYEGAFSLMPNLQKVNGLTVQKVHGYLESIKKIEQQYPNAEVETMEGAAFFEAFELYNIPFSEIRAISNFVEPRNKAAWEIEKAIENLNKFLIHFLMQ